MFNTPLLILIAFILLFNILKHNDEKFSTTKPYVFFLILISIVSITGMVLCKHYFLKRLHHSATIRSFEDSFMTWAIQKFNTYFFHSIIVTLILVFILSLAIMLVKNTKGILMYSLSYITIVCMILLPIISFIYGLSTINKLFDIAIYIQVIFIFEMNMFLIPLVIKRIRLKRARD